LPELLIIQLVRAVAVNVGAQFQRWISVRFVEAGLRRNVVMVNGVARFKGATAGMAKREIPHRPQGSLVQDCDHVAREV